MMLHKLPEKFQKQSFVSLINYQLMIAITGEEYLILLYCTYNIVVTIKVKFSYITKGSKVQLVELLLKLFSLGALAFS